MRADLTYALIVAGVLAAGLTAGSPTVPSGCPTSAGMADASKKTHPSSFAPRPRPPHNAYGAPLGTVGDPAVSPAASTPATISAYVRSARMGDAPHS